MVETMMSFMALTVHAETQRVAPRCVRREARFPLRSSSPRPGGSVQFTVRLPRFVATAFAIVVAAVAVTAVVPATAASDTSIVVCIDPTTKNLTVDPACSGSTLTWNQQGVAGTNGATGAIG